MKIKVISVYERKLTSGTNPSTGKKFNGSVQNFEAFIHGTDTKARFSVMGMEDMSHLKGNEYDLTGYVEKEAWQGKQQFSVNYKSKFVQLNKPADTYPVDEDNGYYGNIDDRIDDGEYGPNKTGTNTATPSTTQKKLDAIMNEPTPPHLQKADKFLQVLRRLQEGQDLPGQTKLNLGPDNITKIAISILISEDKNK